MSGTPWLGAGVALGLGVALLVSTVKEAARRRRLRAHFRRADEAERRAARRLESRGYRILEVQPECPVEFRVGGRRVRGTIRADYLVSRWFRRHVVEVKSGEVAPDPTFRATRRQLREYAAVFPWPVLLFDANTGELARVEFRDGRRRAMHGGPVRFLLCLAAWWALTAGRC